MESNETKAGVSPVLSTGGLCGCGREARYMVMRDGKSVWACNKYMRCLTYEERGDALTKANLEAYRLKAENDALRDFITATICKDGIGLSVSQSPTTGKFLVTLFATHNAL